MSVSAMAGVWAHIEEVSGEPVDRDLPDYECIKKPSFMTRPQTP